MGATFKRLVLKPPADFDAAARHLNTTSWTLHDFLEENRARMVPREYVYVSRDGQSAIHIVDDFVAGFCYLAVQGRLAEPTARLLPKKVPMYSDDELLAWVEGADTPESLGDGIRRLGVAAPSAHDPRIFAAFERAFTHSDARARVAAVQASAYPSWPEFKPVLERLVRDDPDATVRAEATIMLEAFAEQGI
jgi:hypothetical protein